MIALTPRQLEVARLISEGFCDKEIASALGIVLRTVNEHKQNIRKALELRNTPHIAAWYARNFPDVPEQISSRTGHAEGVSPKTPDSD